VSRNAILGAGSWGTALGVLLAEQEHEVVLWDHDRPHLHQVDRDRENRKFLPGIGLPSGIKVQPELELALVDVESVVFAVPSHALRMVGRGVAATGRRGLWVCASKGLELETLLRPTEVLADALEDRDVVALVGPSHAEEVSRHLPTSVVAAARNETRGREVQRLFSTPRFRVYTNTDVAGCEYGAALKNVIAIAAGVCDGLGYGDNTKGALLTRGLAEIARLGVALGGRRDTFFGLTGMGDLITTATSRHSRNRALGERLGRGESLEQALSSTVMVAEGVNTARAAQELGRKHDLEMPLTDQVCAILLEGRNPREALDALMTRQLKSEEWKGGAGIAATES
jgi:glycerol-3-phosphate dehydrogenase (NAD(P)+)